jgi:hypothetical protein
VSTQLNSQACIDARAAATAESNDACASGCSDACEAVIRKQSSLQNARQFYQICQPSEFETNFYLSSSKILINQYNQDCGTDIDFDLTFESITEVPTLSDYLQTNEYITEVQNSGDMLQSTATSDNETQNESSLETDSASSLVAVTQYEPIDESQTVTQSGMGAVSESNSSTSTVDDLPTNKYFQTKKPSHVQETNVYIIGGSLAVVAAAGLFFFRRRSSGFGQIEQLKEDNVNTIYEGIDNHFFDESE